MILHWSRENEQVEEKKFKNTVKLNNRKKYI